MLPLKRFKFWHCKLSTMLCKLWISSSPVSLHPSLVNVHIQHPPEADVQIHQVARVQPGQRPATTEGAHSVQQRSQPGNGHEHASEHSSRHPHANGNGHGHATTHIRQNGNVGRCFQETVDGQVPCTLLSQLISIHIKYCGLGVETTGTQCFSHSCHYIVTSLNLLC